MRLNLFWFRFVAFRPHSILPHDSRYTHYISMMIAIHSLSIKSMFQKTSFNIHTATFSISPWVKASSLKLFLFILLRERERERE